MALTEKQKAWQRQYYRRKRRFDRKWLANNQKRQKERLAKQDPNIAAQYFAERHFRFSRKEAPAFVSA